jgi:hypothetical protein
MSVDLIDRLAATPSALAHLVAEVSDEALDASGSGEWSARTLLAHFRDDEYLCMRVALERSLAEHDPLVSFIDGADWEPGRNRTRERKEHLLADFALQRQASLGILRLMRPEDWSRKAHTAERAFTVTQFVTAWVNHDRDHVAQLERALGETLEAVRERRRRMA